MEKLTKEEVVQECIKFKKYLLLPLPIGINDYKENEFISKTFKQDVDFISSALIAWLYRAELSKGKQDDQTKLA